MDIVKHNQVAWENQSNQAESPWVKAVSRDEMAEARAGNWQVILTPTKPVPQEWFGDIRGKELLGLASKGGEQVPLFAVAGAQVTSFDNSPVQLAKDEYVALRDGLDIAYEQGDMADLSLFDDESFDLFPPGIQRLLRTHSAGVASLCANTATQRALAQRFHESRLLFVRP